MNKNKLLKQGLLKAAIIATIILCCTTCGIAYAETIEEYEQEIQNNNYKIEQVEIIKEQLHITAELLRQNEDINNGLDEILSTKWFECESYKNTKLSENADIQHQIDVLKEQQSNRRYVGSFKITHYCPCYTCNGSWGSKTALGTTMTPYRTIAVDPNVIPLGSKVEINGNIYIAEDTGGAIKGNRIDLCVSSHSEAYSKGVLYNVPVYIMQ